MKGFNMQQIIQGTPERRIIAGSYTRLVYSRFWQEIIMSDTPAELTDHAEFIGLAYGDVLITGLGLGYVTQECLENDLVTSVTVIECEQYVLNLVADHYLKRYSKLQIVHSDAFKWVPDGKTRFDSVFHDIWPAISPYNLPGMKTLHRRYGQWLKKGGFQMSWCRKMIENRLRRENKNMRCRN